MPHANAHTYPTVDKENRTYSTRFGGVLTYENVTLPKVYNFTE